MGRLRAGISVLTVPLWGVGLALGARDAGAQGQRVPVSLELTRGVGTENCIGETKLRRRVEERLGRELSPSGQGELHISGDIAVVALRKGASGFRVRLVIRDANRVIGEREFTETGPSCALLTEPLVLAISLMIDPDSALAAAAAEGTENAAEGGAANDGSTRASEGTSPGATKETTTEPTPATSAGEPAESPSPAGASSPAERPSGPPSVQSANAGQSAAKPDAARPDGSAASGTFGLAFAGVGRAAILPGVSWGGSVGIYLFPGSLGLELEGALFGPRVAEQAPHSVQLSYFEANVRLCPRIVSRPRWRWAGCAGFHLGSLGATGEGFDLPANDRALVGQGSVGTEISRLLLPTGSSGGGWALLRASALFPFLRPRVFYFEGPTEVLLYEAPDLGGELQLGFRLEFP